MEDYLNSLSATYDLLLFPVRLETRFDHSGSETCLKIRIIPDEIQFQYEVDNLTKTDLDEGQRFWIRWFIASGDADREFEEWRIFCEKHGVNNASRIASLTRPADLDKYRINGVSFKDRPYAVMHDGKLIDMSVCCKTIYESLAKVHLSEHSVPKKELMEGVRECFNQIYFSLRDINALLGYEYTVDYLYDKVYECYSYLSQRVESIHIFYEKNSSFRNDPDLGDFFDRDSKAFDLLEGELVLLQKKLSQNAKPLEEMVQIKLGNEDFCVKFFGDKNYYLRQATALDSYRPPQMPVLPDRFFASLKGTVDGRPFEKTVEGNAVAANSLQMGIDFHSDASGFSVANDGTVNVPPALKWMIDYNEAVSKGMGITVPLGKGSSFHVDYLYVYGVKADSRSLLGLFKSHLYWKKYFSLLKTGEPTNQVDGARPSQTLSDEELIREKYRLEILEEGLLAPSDTDGHKLSSLLNISYDDTLARTLHNENTELHNSKVANEVLWDWFEAKMINPDYIKAEAGSFYENKKFFVFLKRFFLEHANARGIAPMFRIDNQPYGIIPVSDLDSLHFAISTYEHRYLRMFFDAILAVGKQWKAICEKDLIASEGMRKDGAEQKFLQMVSQNPHSVRFDQRVFYYGPRKKSEGDEDGLVYSSELLQMLSDMGLNNPVPVGNTAFNYGLDDLIKEVKKKLPTLENWQASQLVSEFMDAFTHRVDIWATAMISWFMKDKPSFRTGSYGWVFNLDSKTGYSSKMKGEYILAPSIQHALTAAVLRSAYLQTKKDAMDTHMCINLSSMRARQALRMIDGIKQGMPTGLILGTDLERYLHDAHSTFKEEMDLLIYPLRKLFPLTMDIKAKDKGAQAYSLQVINGEALLNSFLSTWGNNGRISSWLETNAGSLTWFKELVNDFEQQAKDNKDNKGTSLFTRSKQLVLFKLIERMADSYDALNDLLLAEGVHRLVAGDRESFAAIAQFMSKGSGNLPSPAVLDTPVDYAVLAHKVGMALPRVTKENDSVLLKADPAVGAWIASQMGSLDKVVFYVDYTDGEENSSEKMYLSDIGLAPMEFLYLSSYPKVLVQTLEILWREKDWKNRKLGLVRILTGDPAELGSGEMLPTDDKEMLLYEFSLLTDSLSSLLGCARSMRPGDIVPSLAGSDEEDDLVNVEELKTRYESVFNLLQQKKTGLDSFIKEIEGKDLTYEMVATAFGWVRDCTLAGLINESIAYDTALILEGVDPVKQRALYDKILEKQQKFIGQLKATSKVLETKLESAAAIAVPGNAPILTTSAYTEAIQTLTLKNLRVTCRFSVTGKTLPKEVNPAKKLGDNAFLDWVDEISEVRPGMKLFHELSMLQQIQGESALDRKKGIFQEQAQGKVVDEWLGCQVTDESLLDDTDSLVLFERQEFDEKTDNAGLIFDSWLEYIPFRKQTAGLVYRCDIPDAEAPQALMYVLYPEKKTSNLTWSKEVLVNAFRSAETLFKIRTVDPDQLYANKKYGLLGSLLSARKKNLVTIDPSDPKDPGEQQREQISNLIEKKEDLVLNVGQVKQEVIDHIKEYK